MLGLLSAMLFPELFLFMIIGIVLFGVAVAFFYRAGNKIAVLVGLLCILVGMFIYTVTYNGRIQTVQPLYYQKATVTATVTERHIRSNGRIAYTLNTLKIVPENKTPCVQNLKLKIVTKTEFYAEPDETIRFDAVFSSYNTHTSYSFNAFADGCYLKVSVISQQPEIIAENVADNYFFSTIRCGIQSKLSSCFNRKQSGLLYALLTGDKSELDTDIGNTFRTAGISHIIAVSGLHLSVIVGSVFWLLMKITRKTGLSSGITIFVILFYVVLTAYPYSVIRSAIMNILLLISLSFHRKTQPINSLGAAGLCITLVNPLAIGDIALLMSFSATLGIIVMQKAVSTLLLKGLPADNTIFRKFWQKPVRYAAECVSVSVSAVLFTLPVMIFVYKKFSVYFILSNLITTAAAPFLIIMGWIIVILSCFPFLTLINTVLVFAEQHLCGFVITTAENISALPHSCISLDNFYVETAFACVLCSVILFFLPGNFHIREKRLCLLLCTALTITVLSFGYFTDSQTLTFYISGNAKGISVVESHFDTVNILLCGGDHYHYDDTENFFFDKDIRSLFVFGNKAYFSNYAMKITENYPVEQIVVYSDKETYHYLSPEKSVITVPENGDIRYGKYTLQTFTVNKKNWCYIAMTDGKGILIAPPKADCNDIPEQYRKVHTAVLPKSCINSHVVSAENVLIGNGYQTFVWHKSLNGGVYLWQK